MANVASSQSNNPSSSCPWSCVDSCDDMQRQVVDFEAMNQYDCLDCKTCCVDHTEETCREHCEDKYKALVKVEHSECKKCVCDESSNGKYCACCYSLVDG